MLLLYVNDLSFNCTYLIECCVILRNYIHIIDYRAQRGCLTYKRHKRSERQSSGNRIALCVLIAIPFVPPLIHGR